MHKYFYIFQELYENNKQNNLENRHGAVRH